MTSKGINCFPYLVNFSKTWYYTTYCPSWRNIPIRLTLILIIQPSNQKMKMIITDSGQRYHLEEPFLFQPGRWSYLEEKLIYEEGRKNNWFFVCLGFYAPIENLHIFTQMETSPLPLKGCKFWPMHGTYNHWAVRVPLKGCKFWPMHGTYNHWAVRVL